MLGAAACSGVAPEVVPLLLRKRMPQGVVRVRMCMQSGKHSYVGQTRVSPRLPTPTGCWLLPVITTLSNTAAEIAMHKEKRWQIEMVASGPKPT